MDGVVSGVVSGIVMNIIRLSNVETCKTVSILQLYLLHFSCRQQSSCQNSDVTHRPIYTRSRDLRGPARCTSIAIPALFDTGGELWRHDLRQPLGVRNLLEGPEVSLHAQNDAVVKQF